VLQAPNASTRAAMREASAIGKARFASTHSAVSDNCAADVPRSC
jgi:hypothetical protein